MAKTPKKMPSAFFDLPALWSLTKRALPRMWRLSKSPRSRSPHTIGGPVLHRGARCANCKSSLTLLWSLAVDDKCFTDEFRELLAPCKKLPLYICWKYVSAAYQVKSETKIVTFEPTHEWIDEDSPFADAPLELPKRRVSFSPVSTFVDCLYSSDILFEYLDKEAISCLENYLGTRDPSPCELGEVSQLGGRLALYQGERDTVCPNPKCPAHELTFPFGGCDIPFLMKELALLTVDADQVLEPHYFQVAFNICIVCSTINAHYECT
jgi:hypothetical protein